MVDYLIVGLGLAGMALCETLEKNGKTFRVVNDDSQCASRVAAGLYNPVVLKRFSLAWKASEQLELVPDFYADLEHKLKCALHEPLTVLRKFAGPEEHNRWFEAADTHQLQPFLSTRIRKNENDRLHAPYGFGEVRHTGRVHTRVLLEAYTSHLKAQNRLIEESLDYEALQIEEDYVAYRSARASRIVFCTGFGLTQNPYFNYLPLNGTKGELLEIHCPELKEHHAIKSSVFLIPLGADHYSVGATYQWKDYSNDPTTEAREYLLDKLRTFLNIPFTVTRQQAGIRPTVPDRRPLVGKHPEHDRLYVLNGFGSRGVMIAPFAAAQLYRFMELGESLDPEMDISRFERRWLAKKEARTGDQNG